MVDVICTYCGKIINRAPSEIKANCHNGRFFCNREESDAYRKDHPELYSTTKKTMRFTALKYKGEIYA